MTFVDPRGAVARGGNTPSPSTTTEAGELHELHRLCREGRLYEVERWIQADRPMQVVAAASDRGTRLTSALEIGIHTGNHALVRLLLANGYDPNLEARCPLDLALRARRFDLVDLLLEWGADPLRVDLDGLFDTYSSELFERFQKLGIDLTREHALASALAYHTSNRPLFGFAKRHRETNPKMQTELNIALGYHVSEENEKGTQLCLWAGANPHVPALDLRYWRGSTQTDDEGDDEEAEWGVSAIEAACHHGNVAILKRLGPNPAVDDFDRLYQAASSRAVVDLLAERGLPRDVGAVIQHQLWWATLDFRRWQSTETLHRLFEIGLRWTQASAEEIAALRRSLLKASDSTFVDLMKLMATGDYCSAELLKALARTPAIQAKMRKVGFIPAARGDPQHFNQLRPTRSREVLKKFGVEIPETRKAVHPPLPDSVRVGAGHRDGREICLKRAELFDRVWSQPVARLAAEWGLSGPGLKKVCRMLQVPVPPRGYWARLRAGHRVRRPHLRELPNGLNPKIFLRVP